MRLGYIGLETQQQREWRQFSEEIIGMEYIEGREVDYLRIGDDGCKFILIEGDKEDIAFCGLEAGTEAEFQQTVSRLTAATIELQQGTREESEQRGVERFFAFADDDGHLFEIALGCRPLPGAFSSPLIAGSFVSGASGLGHAVFSSRDCQLSEDFHCRLLNASVSDRIKTELGSTPLTMSFLNVNRRHHSLAFVQSEALRSKRLQHIMVELESLEDLGLCYERVLDHKIPLMLTLGQHTNDKMLSFYCLTPSGYPLEVGWGGVAPAGDGAVRTYDKMSIWGHKFQQTG